MPSQVISWTALPNGISVSDNGKKQSDCRYLLLQDCRLMGNLSSSPELADWLDWPSKIKSMKFHIIFGDESDHEWPDAEYDPSRKFSVPDSKLWTSLFKKDTIIKSHDFEESNYANTKYIIKTFSAIKNHEFLKQRLCIYSKRFAT